MPGSPLSFCREGDVMYGRKKLLLVGTSIAVFAALAMLSITLAVSTIPAIEILDGSGHRLELLPIEDGVFVHRYIHSIHKTAVDEEFMISGGTLELFRLRYDTYGVGMPSDGGERFRIEDNRFVVDMKRSFKRLDIRVSHLPGHGIEANGIFHPFTEWVPAESLITLKAGTRYLFFARRKARL
jgi:hypothetical protein